jgi:hypothetical protein
LAYKSGKHRENDRTRRGLLTSREANLPLQGLPKPHQRYPGAASRFSPRPTPYGKSINMTPSATYGVAGSTLGAGRGAWTRDCAGAGEGAGAGVAGTEPDCTDCCSDIVATVRSTCRPSSSMLNRIGLQGTLSILRNGRAILCRTLEADGQKRLQRTSFAKRQQCLSMGETSRSLRNTLNSLMVKESSGSTLLSM